jgi:hypothetical protein
MRWFCLSVIGLGIGLLAGLSVSPVLSIVLTSLVGAAATFTAVFGNYIGARTRSLPEVSQKKLDTHPAPLAVLVVTLVVGALVGLYSRVHLASIRQSSEIKAIELAPPASLEKSVKAWTNLGLDQSLVTKGLFESYLGITKDHYDRNADHTALAATVGLFSVSAEECARFRTLPDDRLRVEMQAAESDVVSRIAEKVSDVEVLRLVTTLACEREAKQHD